MRVDAVYFMIAVVIGVILSYALWSISGELANFIAIGSAIYFCSTLGLAFGVRHESSRTRVNLSALSATFFAIGLSINLSFCFAGNVPVLYLMVNTVSFLIYLALVNFIEGADT